MLFIIVALMDNVLRPIPLGRGIAVPIVGVFLGAIGGFVALGIIGLFVRPSSKKTKPQHVAMN
ncbi:MAG TPA: hypothetical protein VF783_12125 [Terriglobales bacterium]